MTQIIRIAIGRSDTLRCRVPRCYASAVLLLAGALLLSGCATAPFPKELTEQAKFQPNFFSLSMDPDAYKGTTAIYGGNIIRTTNFKDHTDIEVLQKSLDSSYAPEDMDTASGRFLVRCSEFLDPAIYKPGQEISVAGEIQGKELRMLGEVPYTYPILSCRKLKLWYESVDAYYYPTYGWGGYWGYGGYGGYGWYNWPYYYGPVFRRRLR